MDFDSLVGCVNRFGKFVYNSPVQEQAGEHKMKHGHIQAGDVNYATNVAIGTCEVAIACLQELVDREFAF